MCIRDRSEGYQSDLVLGLASCTSSDTRESPRFSDFRCGTHPRRDMSDHRHPQPLPAVALTIFATADDALGFVQSGEPCHTRSGQLRALSLYGRPSTIACHSFIV